MKTKIFLTGISGIGKSTIIKRLIQNKKNISGFKTFCVSEKIFISKINSKKKYLIGKKNFDEKKPIGYTKGIENFGVKILEESMKEMRKKNSIYIMDELGIIESEAKNFQKKILEILNTDINILGVIKNSENKFLNKIKKDEKIKFINITEKNREEILSELEKEFEIE